MKAQREHRLFGSEKAANWIMSAIFLILIILIAAKGFSQETAKPAEFKPPMVTDAQKATIFRLQRDGERYTEAVERLRLQSEIFKRDGAKVQAQLAEFLSTTCQSADETRQFTPEVTDSDVRCNPKPGASAPVAKPQESKPEASDWTRDCQKPLASGAKPSRECQQWMAEQMKEMDAWHKAHTRHKRKARKQ